MAQDSIGGGNSGNLPFFGKIAVITNLPFQTQNDEEFWSGEQALAKYGSNNIIHLTWPAFFVQEREQVDAVISTLSVNSEIKALVINQAVPGCNTAVEKLRKYRDDIFVVYCLPHETLSVSAERANMILMPNEFGMGAAIVKQAKKQGATAFVHYSFPRHMAIHFYASCRDTMRETCKAEGLEFLNATALDPMGETGNYSAEQFILEDVPKMVARYGENTAFYSTNCFLQVPLIKSVVDAHAIFPQPCCPSPYHGFPEALGIEIGEGIPDLNYVINETSRIAAAKNMTGRLSTWPVPLTMIFTNAGVEYAIKWIKGEVPRTGIDDKILKDCMAAYILESSGRAIDVNLISYNADGKEYNSVKMLFMNHLDY